MGLCIFMWIYVNAVILPGFIPQMQELKMPLEDAGCILQYQPSLQVEFLIFASAELVMLLAFPIIFYKPIRRLKVQQETGGNFSGNTGGTAANGPVGISGPPDQSTQSTMKRRRSPNDTSHSFMVLALLTCNVFICWTPATVTFIVSTSLSVQFPTVFQVVLTVYDMVPVLDPILLAVAMKDLRKALYHLFSAPAS